MLTNFAAIFPNLNPSGGYKRTSPSAKEYNCIAWAAGIDSEWWEPDPFGLWAWPPKAPREYSVQAYIAAYQTLGFRRCPSAIPEVGFEKIAIFTKGGVPQHAARLLGTGEWTSKMGQDQDISHALDGLNGSVYGDHSVYMKRRITTAPQPGPPRGRKQGRRTGRR